MDILLNEAGDSVFVNGPLTAQYTTQNGISIVRQRLILRLMTWRNEWFLDTQYGVPYLDILGRKVPKSRVDSILQQEILKEVGVKEITTFSSTLKDREYVATFRVKVDTGEVTEAITISPTS